MSESVSVDAWSADAICGACEFFIASDSSGGMYASRRSSFCCLAAFCVGTVGDAFCAVSVSAAKLKSPLVSIAGCTPEDDLVCVLRVRERWMMSLSSCG